MSTQDLLHPHLARPHSVERDHSLQTLYAGRVDSRRRIGQLENKACFFEGQVNPLAFENKALKERVQALSRRISGTSDVLRSLLLMVEEHPIRQLKIQMASLEEVAALIREDWLASKQETGELKEQLDSKNTAIEGLKKRELMIVANYEKSLAEQKSQF
jgi:hypothetical protein